VSVEVVVALIGGGAAVVAGSFGVVIELLRRLGRRNDLDHAAVLEGLDGLGVAQRETRADLLDVKADLRDVRLDVRELSEDQRLLRDELSDRLGETPNPPMTR
jgi:hypothetical protein